MRLIMEDYIKKIEWIIGYTLSEEDIAPMTDILEEVFSSWTYAYSTEHEDVIKKSLIEFPNWQLKTG